MHHDSSTEPPAAVADLTDDEKIALVSGYGLWRTTPIERAGIPSIVMADGPNGLRYSREQADESPRTGGDFSDFIGLVTRRGAAAAAPARPPEPATCFPTASTVGAAWNTALASDLGAAFAEECRSFGVSMLLGPGMNIRRTPLAGRTSEYYSEDPLLTSEMAAALVAGLQQEGVGACVKHFAANNSEIERTSMSSDVDARALRDIYLRGFERVIRKADPWAVMSSYNRVGGVQAAQSGWLLRTVLRDEWGYRGAVVSDWHGITDRPASVTAGNDLDMPQSRQRTERLREAVRTGAVRTQDLDRAASNVLDLVRRASAARREAEPFDADAHHALARRIAREGTVLLANDGVLPLSAAEAGRILVLGEGATTPVIQGFGSARMTPTRVDIPVEEIARRVGGDRVTHLPGVSEDDADAHDRAVAAAAEHDVVVVFAHTDQNRDGENADRADLSLAPGYDDLIGAVAAVARRTIVVLTVPDAVEMPWLDRVNAVLAPFYAGQGMGDAVAALLFGEADPSGRLATTFPRRIEDTPAFLGYPGEGGRHVYVDGPFVGYRGYDIRGIDPLFPFGFGLSYTRFEVGEPEVVAPDVVTGGTVTVRVRVRNVGDRAGAEVVQVYASFDAPRVRVAPRELVGFTKVALEPGEETWAEIAVDVADLAHWDVRRGRRVLDDGTVRLAVGTSSRDLAGEVSVTVASDVPRWRPLQRDTETTFVLAHPAARAAVRGLLVRHLDVDEDQADDLLQQCAKSFVNVFDTIANRFQLVLDEDEIARVIAQVADTERAAMSR